LGGEERRGEEGSWEEGEEEQQESFKNLTYLSAKKSPFLKEKESKGGGIKKPFFYIPWNPESSIGGIIRVFSNMHVHNKPLAEQTWDCLSSLQK